ncbi:tetratricopeptide repeat protein, partial [Stenotrophomonas maltophilia]|uniref:tetratricopeptide repeat protein n=1 Tax=Stenotrophomonas maltophilia TaxID=40324 RepID=UPI0013DA6F48
PVQSAESQAEAELAPLIAMAEQALAEGEAEHALALFEQIADLAPDHSQIIAGRARALLARGRVDEAEAMLATLPEDAKGAE